MIPFQSFGNSLKWRFDNMNSLKGNETRFSDVFSIGPTGWKIAAYNSAGYLSIYLHYDSQNEKDENWFCEVEATLKLLRRTDSWGEKRENLEKKDSYALDSSRKYQEYRLHTDFSRLYSDGYKEDDAIIIEIDLNFVYHDFSKKIEYFTDVIVNVEDKRFHLNKGVLCSKSKYFYDLFITQKSTETVITLDNIKSTDFCYILIPFNPNFSSIEENTYKNLLKIAKDFGVQLLYHSCEQYLMTKNTTSRRILKIKLADENGFDMLMRKIIESIGSAKDIKNLMSEPNFSLLTDNTKWRIMMRILDFV